MADDRNRIGNLNGKWSLLFRFMLGAGALVLPSLTALEIWQVVTIYEIRQGQSVHKTRLDYFMLPGDRYTQRDANADLIKSREIMRDEIAKNYPPAWLTDEVKSISRRLESIERQLLKVGKTAPE